MSRIAIDQLQKINSFVMPVPKAFGISRASRALKSGFPPEDCGNDDPKNVYTIPKRMTVLPVMIIGRTAFN